MHPITQFQQLKVLGDPQRAAILRRLMADPATLSQLGVALQVSPAHVRHHLKALEQAGFVTLESVRPVRNFQEKYYRASAAAYTINLVLLPELADGQTALVIGSNDAALQQIEAHFSAGPVFARVAALDSLAGLVKLREGVCQAAACHLPEPGGGEFNRGFVRHLFPGQAMGMIHLYRREEGLLVQAGNPKGIRGLADLARAGVRMVNRERGSGVRAWLDDQLRGLGISPASLAGYADEAGTHEAVARAVRVGRADVGLGLSGRGPDSELDFIPLFEEPYDLVFAPEMLADGRVAPFFSYLTSQEFRAAAERLGGYHVTPEFGRVEMVA